MEVSGDIAIKSFGGVIRMGVKGLCSEESGSGEPESRKHMQLTSLSDLFFFPKNEQRSEVISRRNEIWRSMP